MPSEIRVVKVVATGTGSYRITIPRDMMPEIETTPQVGLSKVKGGLLVSLLDIKIKKEPKS